MFPRTLLVGCGEKQVSKIGKCIAIDIDPNCIKRSKKLEPNNTYILTNVEELSFKNNYFSKIICTEVLEHTSEPNKALEEMLRVLNFGGRLYLSFPLKEYAKELAQKFPAYKRDFYHGFHKSELDENKIKNLLSGLKVIQYKRTGRESYVFWRLIARIINFMYWDVEISEIGKIKLRSRSNLKRKSFNLIAKGARLIAILSAPFFGKYTTLMIEIEK